jgi:hypothetical protein
MSASVNTPKTAEEDELDALFKTFDTTLREVQQKFSDIEKDLATLRKENAAGDEDPPAPDNKDISS